MGDFDGPAGALSLSPILEIDGQRGEEFSFFSFSKAPPTFGIRVLLIRLLSLMYYYYIVLFPCNFDVYFTPVGSSS
jgi:hypothetical protein